MNPFVLVPSFAGGVVVWSFAEYALHRWMFHERRGRNYGSREHLRHHARRDYVLAKAWQAWVGVLAAGWGLYELGIDLGSRTAGAGLGVGFVAAFFFYEWIHAMIHIRPPRNAYGRWTRKNHLHHHFGAPLKAHGVTSPIWDKVFGTYEAPSVVPVPRRLALPWMFDADGNQLPEYAGEYPIRGAGDAESRRDEDMERAFANVAPLE